MILRRWSMPFAAYLNSLPLKLFLTSLVLHIVVQLLLNTILPLPFYSELNNHDGTVHYAISLNPLPDAPEFTVKRYQRALLPLLVWALFPWDRHFGFAAINIVAVSLAATYFYLIMQEHAEDDSTALRLVFLCATTPYLFASAHMGLTEPLMLVALLAGYFHARRGELWPASAAYALAMLTKEIALLPVLAEFVLLVRRVGLRRSLPASLPLLASFLPVGLWYLLVGLRWGDLFWMLGGTEGQTGFAPAAIVDILRNPPAVASVPPIFFIVNQMANILLLGLIIAGLYGMRRSRPLVIWVGLSVFPLLFLGRAVYEYNFDIGRQALPAVLLFAALRRSWLLRDGRLCWPAIGGLLVLSLFWTLYYARLFVFYKF